MDSEPDSGGGGVEIWLIREESGWLGGVRWDWLWRWVGILFRFLVGETRGRMKERERVEVEAAQIGRAHV